MANSIKFNPPKGMKYTLIGLTSATLVLKADAKPAEAVYERFTTYIQGSLTTFLGAVGGGAVAPIATSAIGLLPWLVIVLAGGIIIWQAYAGYQEWQRENYSGISKPVANILVTIILVFLTDALSALLVGPAA